MVKMGLTIMLAVAGMSALRAQTADEIVNKYLDAIGGKEKLVQIKTISMEGTSQAMGNESPTKVNIITGSAYKLQSETNGQSMIVVITDKGGWQIIPYLGQTSPTATPDDAYKQVKGKLDIFGPLYDYTAKGSKIELLGKEGGAFKLKVTDKDNLETTVFIDTASYFFMTKLTITQILYGTGNGCFDDFFRFQKSRSWRNHALFYGNQLWGPV